MEDVIVDSTEGETLAVSDNIGTKRKPGFFLMEAFRRLESVRRSCMSMVGLSQDKEAKRQVDSAIVDVETQLKVLNIRFFLSGQFKT